MYDRKRWGWGLLGIAMLLVVLHGFYRHEGRFIVELMGVVFSLVMLLAMFEINYMDKQQVEEHRQKEDAAKVEMDYLRSLFSSSRVALGVMDPESGNVLEANRAFAGICGLDSMEDLLGKRLETFFAPSQQDGSNSVERFRAQMGMCLLDGNNIFVHRFQKSGGELWDGEVRMMRFEHGGRLLVEISLQDITERLRSEAGTAQDQHRLKSLMSLHEKSMEPEDVLIEQAMRDAMTLVDSPSCVLHFLDPEERVVKKSYWSDRHTGACRCDGNRSLSLEDAGSWADAYYRREAVIDNEVPPSGIGWPEGHLPVIRHLCVPVFDKENVVVLASAFNNAKDYTPLDAQQLRFFIGGLWNLLRRKRAEDSLRKLTMAVEYCPVAIVIADTNATMEYVNPAFSKVTGYSYSEAVGQNPRILQSGAFSRDQYQEMWHKLKNGNVWSGIFHNKRKDGSLFWERSIIAPVKDATGRVTCYLAVKEDITEARAVEALLKESEERWRFAIESTGDGFWDWDIETGRIFHSERWLTIMMDGGDSECSDMDAWKGRVHPEDLEKALTALELCLSGEAPSYVAEYRMKRGDGAYVWILDRGKVVKRSEGGKPLRVMGTQSDITERKRAEELVIGARKLESMAVLAGGIAHDFNNLFTGALGNLDIAELSLSQNAPERVQIEKVRLSILKASDLSRQMLAFSGMGRFGLGRLELNYIVDQWKESLERVLAPGVRLEVDLSEIQPVFDGDIYQVQQMLEYLVVNASESMEDKSGVIRVATGFRMLEGKPQDAMFFGREFKPGLFAMLKVEDEGCGMTAEVLPRIFEPFFSTKFVGRGMSLAVVQGILRAHDAGILVESRPGKGSKFQVFFPVATEDLLPEAVPVRNEIRETQPRCRRILVVDDEDMLREAISELLEGLGYEVLQAVDGQEGLDIFRRHYQEIGLVIMDLTMPRMDGRTAFLAMKELDPNALIVLSSGYSEVEVTGPVKDKGLAGFLPKPYQFKDIAAMVERLQGA